MSRIDPAVQNDRVTVDVELTGELPRGARPDLAVEGLILDEKSQEPAWTPPLSYSIEPAPESRLFDPSPIEDPIFPDPKPRLHVYEIPNGIGRRADLPAPTGVPTETAMTTSVRQAGYSSDKSATGRILLARYAAQNELEPDSEDFKIEPVTIPPSA